VASVAALRLAAVAPDSLAFAIVGVTEASERVGQALKGRGPALPAGQMTVNLAPPDLAKDGIIRCHLQIVLVRITTIYASCIQLVFAILYDISYVMITTLSE